MNHNFEVFKLKNEAYDFLVIATSYENPLNSMDEIEKEIQAEKANLLVDLTLINGTNKNRYIGCEYDASANSMPSCTMVEEVSDSIKKISQNYFTVNKEIVEKGTIPNSLKQSLLAENNEIQLSDEDLADLEEPHSAKSYSVGAVGSGLTVSQILDPSSL